MSIEFAALAVVPITCRSESPASFVFGLLVGLPEGMGVLLKGELDGVSLTQGVLMRCDAGVVVAIAMLWNYCFMYK